MSRNESFDLLQAAARRSLAALFAATALSACAQTQPQRTEGEPVTAETSAAAPAPSSPASVSLLVQGYNYTDHYIDSFSVNGQGGGNIFESGPESGGGKSVCCVSWWPGSKLPVKIKVRWVTGYCRYTEKNPYTFGRPYNEKRRSLWKEQDALITEASAATPRALEVHFYRDGRIEAAVTSGYSPPRLKLQRDVDYNRPGVSQEFPRCTDEPK